MQQHKDQPKPPETLKDGGVGPESKIVPEGRKLEKETNPEPSIVPERRKLEKKNTIRGMFAKQKQKAENKNENEILKEERLVTKKRLELKWKSMKTHNMRINWTTEWLEEKLITPVISAGHEIVNTRVEKIVTDILDESIMIGEGRKQQTRLETARRRKETLLRYLDRWWTTLEEGVPDLEVDLEPHTLQRGEKRKKDATKKEKLRKD